MPVQYLDQAKSFLQRNSTRLLLRAVPLALAAAAVAHAAPTFGSAITRSITNCSGGGAVAGTLGGALANAGHGVILAGNGSLTKPSEGSYDCLKYTWQGTGSGTFDGNTVPALWDFNITQPDNATVYAWHLTFTFDDVGMSSTTTVFDCNLTPAQPGAAEVRSRLGQTPRTIQQQCFGPVTGSHSVNVPSTFAGWRVDLEVWAQWFDGVPTSIGVNVPGGTSIHINAPFTIPAVPAMSPVMLVVTALGLMALAAFGFARWRVVRLS